MVPKKTQPYFELIHQREDNDNSRIEGILTCCNEHDFEVFVAGKVKHGMFFKMCLYSENGKTAIKVRCKKCGKIISVFDSSCDGYEQCGKNQSTRMQTKSIDCPKCQSEGFSVSVIYEYPDIQELEKLEITEIDNAFTWIWVTLECNCCGTRYKNFVNCETT